MGSSGGITITMVQTNKKHTRHDYNGQATLCKALHKAAKIKVLSILYHPAKHHIRTASVRKKNLTIQYIIQHLARTRMKIELPLKMENEEC